MHGHLTAADGCIFLPASTAATHLGASTGLMGICRNLSLLLELEEACLSSRPTCVTSSDSKCNLQIHRHDCQGAPSMALRISSCCGLWSPLYHQMNRIHWLHVRCRHRLSAGSTLSWRH